MSNKYKRYICYNNDFSQLLTIGEVMCAEWENFRQEWLVYHPSGAIISMKNNDFSDTFKSEFEVRMDKLKEVVK